MQHPAIHTDAEVFCPETPTIQAKIAKIIVSIMRRTIIEGWRIVNDFR